jgi:hypothetical protein
MAASQSFSNHQYSSLLEQCYKQCSLLPDLGVHLEMLTNIPNGMRAVRKTVEYQDIKTKVTSQNWTS